jgi:hypothetical protein
MDEVAFMLWQENINILNQEYFALWNNPDILINYRNWPNNWPKKGSYYLYNFMRYQFNHTEVFLPDKYFYSSGCNDLYRLHST